MGACVCMCIPGGAWHAARRKFRKKYMPAKAADTKTIFTLLRVGWPPTPQVLFWSVTGVRDRG